MSKIYVQRLTTITQKQAALKFKQQQIEAELAKTMVAVLRDVHAFTVDFDMLVGGLLDVVKKSKSDTVTGEAWRAQGARFRKRKTRKKRSGTQTPDAAPVAQVG